MLSFLIIFQSCVKDPTEPCLTTYPATEVTSNSAKITGEVTDEGGAEVTVRGICWGETINPTVDGTHLYSGIGAGSFTIIITELEPNKTYHARAYAENSVGIGYGNDIVFETGVAAPSVLTKQVTTFGHTSALSGGDIIYDGGGTILARGVCWSTSPQPDLNDFFTSDGTGSGVYTSTMVNLQPGTRYYYRAYAKNSDFTVFGDERTFNTKVADREGNLYLTVIIGEQVWMAENLRSTRYNDDLPIPNITDDTQWINLSTPAYCWISNDIQYKPVYGALYNWYAVNTGKLCPAGWHVPSDEEYKTLERTLGMTAEQADLTDFRGTDEGKKMKSTTGWADGENGTNTSGFSALPGGYRWAKTGAFNGLGMITYWWSSELNTEYAWYRRIDGTDNRVFRSGTSKEGGKYVR
ncbi:hypothetical protein EG830_14015, partial [bacterium]|nr:hypothetical protein [bacterium]